MALMLRYGLDRIKGKKIIFTCYNPELLLFLACVCIAHILNIIIIIRLKLRKLFKSNYIV